MKLTGELKDKVESEETREEKKNIIEAAGMELTDDELDTVTGGKGTKKRYSVKCKQCGVLGATLSKDATKDLITAHLLSITNAEKHVCEIIEY